MLFTNIASSCGKKPDNRSVEKLNIGFLTDSMGLNDQTFNKKVYSSLVELNLSNKFNLIIRNGEVKDNYLNNLRKIAKICDIIICGYLMNDEVLEVSKEFPDKYFILLDGIASDSENKPVYRSNIVSIIFSEREKAFLAGETVSKSLINAEKVGIICVGEKDELHSRFIIDSFRKGIEKHRLNVEIKYRFIKDPNDSAIALNLFTELVKEECKIIYLCSGGYVTSIIDGLKSSHPFIICEEIGGVKDKENILGVIEKDYMVVLERIFKKVEEGKLKGGVEVFGLSDKAISLRSFPSSPPSSS